MSTHTHTHTKSQLPTVRPTFDLHVGLTSCIVTYILLEGSFQAVDPSIFQI